MEYLEVAEKATNILVNLVTLIVLIKTLNKG